MAGALSLSKSPHWLQVLSIGDFSGTLHEEEHLLLEVRNGTLQISCFLELKWPEMGFEMGLCLFRGCSMPPQSRELSLPLPSPSSCSLQRHEFLSIKSSGSRLIMQIRLQVSNLLLDASH